jgi:hypothetical protein
MSRVPTAAGRYAARIRSDSRGADRLLTFFERVAGALALLTST